MLKRKMVSIERSHIDDRHLQGFILDESDELLLIQYIYDFRLDGLMVLTKSDITRLQINRTCEFHTHLLRQQGLLKHIPFDRKFDLSSWQDFFKSARKDFEFFTIEEERFKEPNYYIGTLEKVKKNHVKIREFTETGRWVDRPTVAKYKNITLCQVGTHYSDVYQQYFKSLATQ